MDQPWSLLPPAFLEELRRIIPPEKLDAVLISLSSERTPSFRINTLKETAKNCFASLKKEDIACEPVPWCSEAFIVRLDQKQKIIEAVPYREGFLYPQSLSSMLATVVLDPKPYEEILDMCAAPGSKTSHIAARMENKGAIIANDSSKARMYRLQENLQSLGVLNTKTSCLPGEWLWKKYPEMFDRVLVDVPCSMEGRFVATDPKTFEDWKPAKGKLLSQKQKYLLRSAVACVKPGGTILHSTCTLNPRENEEVVDWILEKEEGKVYLEKVTATGVESMEGLPEWNGKAFHRDITKTLRILPSQTFEGFYLAKFRKVA